MLAYFLKVNVALALFYAFYRLFCLKDTFFGWRRGALMSFLLLAAVAPLADLEAWVERQTSMIAVAQFYADAVLPEYTAAPDAASLRPMLTADRFFSLLYLVGVALLSARFLFQLASIIHLAGRCPRAEVSGCPVRLLPTGEAPFSFFGWIFINPGSHRTDELGEILTHEQTHARQWHSVDVILSELTCIACWFNPFAWLLKGEVRTNLEYLADQRVLESGHDSRAYQYHLLGLAHHKAAANIYNNFNVLPLKKRIFMMNKKRTRKIGRTKYIMFLPLAALLMVLSNIEAVARSMRATMQAVTTPQDESPQPLQDVKRLPLTTDDYFTNKALQPEEWQGKKEVTVVMNGERRPTVRPHDAQDPDNPVFEVVENMPEFPDGGMAGLMQYLGRSVRYPESAAKAGTQGRVTVSFIVEKDGSIDHVRILRSVSTELDEEAIRVIKGMPKWKPGTQRGKAVRVRYTVPVMFRLTGIQSKQPEAPSGR